MAIAILVAQEVYDATRHFLPWAALVFAARIVM